MKLGEVIKKLEEVLKVYVCPHCESTSFCKYGKEKGIQRYKCKKCNKTFRATTGTTVHQLHKKHLIFKYITLLKEGVSIRKAARIVGIATSTSFDWRHKFLTSLTCSSDKLVKREEVAKGVKIIRLPYSDKGRQKAPEKYTGQSLSLLITGGNNTYIKKLAPQKPVKNASEILSNLKGNRFVAGVPDKALKRAINKTEKLCLEKSTKECKELLVKAKQNAILMKAWMERFQGVATKYLNHYFSWFSILEEVKEDVWFKELCLVPHSRKTYFKTKEL